MRTNRRWRTAAAGLVVGIGLAAGACSSSSGTGTTATTAGGGSATTAKPATATTAKPATATTAKAGPVEVKTATSPLGEILADGQGATLYTYADDTATSSACNTGCAAAWPPLSGTTVEPGSSLAAADFTTITRDDGSTQVAFKGHPLYTYVGDTVAGDIKGQGSSDVWYVIGPDGTVIKKTS